MWNPPRSRTVVPVSGSFVGARAPARQPANQFVISRRHLVQLKTSIRIGQRVIRMLDNEKMRVHPIVASRTGQIDDAGLGKHALVRLVLLDQRQPEERGAPGTQVMVLGVAIDNLDSGTCRRTKPTAAVLLDHDLPAFDFDARLRMTQGLDARASTLRSQTTAFSTPLPGEFTFGTCGVETTAGAL